MAVGKFGSELSNTTTWVTLTEPLLFFQELGFGFYMFKVSGWIKWLLTSFKIANSFITHYWVSAGPWLLMPFVEGYMGISGLGAILHNDTPLFMGG